MGNTPLATIDEFGIHRPTLGAILDYYIGQYRAIYGADIYLGSDSQDGQMIGLYAAGLDDVNAALVACYNAFSPTTAQGVDLSMLVKLNGLKRLVPSASTAVVRIIGQANKEIVDGQIGDENGNIWALPASVVIPPAGQIDVTATCLTLGAIAALPHTITTIVNPQPGWQTVTNPEAAAVGAPVERDAQLRLRQARSTMNASTALLEGIVGAVLALPGVIRARGYHNDGTAPDAMGIPGNCVAIVVDGGNVDQIVATIKAKKGGAGTYGSVIRITTDQYGARLSVRYFPADTVIVTARLTIRQLAPFTSDVLGQIRQTLADTITGLGIGNSIQWNRLYASAYLFGTANGQLFEVVSLAIARGGATPTAADVPILFHEAPLSVPANISVSVVP